MPPRRRAALAAATSLAVLAGSCSLLAVRRPPAPSDVEPRCTTSRLAPRLDLAGAIVTGVPPLVGLSVAGGIGATMGESGDMGPVYLAAAIYLVPAALYTFSTVRGYRRTRRCRELRAAWAEYAADPRSGADGHVCDFAPGGPVCREGLRCVDWLCEPDPAYVAPGPMK